MSNKTKLIVAGLVAGLAATASASTKPPVVTLGGSLDTQVGHQTQKSPFKTAGGANIANIPASTRLDSYGIVNDTKVHLKVDGHGHGFRYGGMIVLNADTSASKENESSVAHQTMMYLESCMGRLEAGSYTGAYDAMKVNGASVARATGGIDGDWKYWVNTDVDSAATVANGTGLNTLILAPALPTARDKSYESNASKVSYYTPTFAGFRAGISYTPDTDQHGTVTNLKGLTKSFTAFSFPGGTNPGNLGSANQTNSFTNVFQGGLSYKHKFNNKLGFKISALGEMGDAKKYLGANNTVVDRHKLKAYEVGAKFTYMGFGLAGSYGDWGKTGLAKSATSVANGNRSVAGAKSGHYWSVGANYVHNCYGASFGYFNSENGGFNLSNLGAVNPSYSATKGKAKVYSIGIDYRVAPGLMPYIEGSQFDLRDKTNLTQTGKNTGSVILGGIKLNF